MAKRLSDSDDSVIRARLDQWGRQDISVDTLRSWEGELSEDQRLIVDLFGDIFTVKGSEAPVLLSEAPLG